MRTTLVLFAVLSLATACRRSHEDAIQATLGACEKYVAGVERKASCDELAELTAAVADPFGDVSNAKTVPEAEEAKLTKCMDAIAEAAEKACKGNKAYARALDKLFGAIAK